MANKSVVLYQSVKTRGKWSLRAVDEDSNRFDVGPFYVTWYEGKEKQSEPVGRDPEHALREARLKRAALAYVAVGGKIKPNGSPAPPVRMTDEQPARKRKSVATAIAEYLENCRERQGKSGYGLAVRTPETYEYRLGFLIEFRPNAFIDEIDAEFVRLFRRFLLHHEKDLGDRSCYNIMQSVSTFLLKNDIGIAKPILKEMSYPPTEVIPYTKEEMNQFFSTCTQEEELLFKFFLQSMGRDMEVAHCEVRDLKFDKCILHISPKPDRNFRLKGKRSGQNKKGRKVPIPAQFMARMMEFCKGKGPRDLVFPNGHGEVEYHFLRKCKNIAKRAGLTNWKDFKPHRWRKTGATMHHERGVSVRKIQAWLGHESLEVTLDYLGVDDAADETSQQQVNNGALAKFV